MRKEKADASDAGSSESTGASETISPDAAEELARLSQAASQRMLEQVLFSPLSSTNRHPLQSSPASSPSASPSHANTNHVEGQSSAAQSSSKASDHPSTGVSLESTFDAALHSPVITASAPTADSLPSLTDTTSSSDDSKPVDPSTQGSHSDGPSLSTSSSYSSLSSTTAAALDAPASDPSPVPVAASLVAPETTVEEWAAALRIQSLYRGTKIRKSLRESGQLTETQLRAAGILPNSTTMATIGADEDDDAIGTIEPVEPVEPLLQVDQESVDQPTASSASGVSAIDIDTSVTKRLLEDESVEPNDDPLSPSAVPTEDLPADEQPAEGDEEDQDNGETPEDEEMNLM